MSDMKLYIYSVIAFIFMMFSALLIVEHPSTYFLKSATSLVSDDGIEYPIVGIDDITEKDHKVGVDPNKAPFILIEYSDYTCLYCAGMRKILKRVVDDYGAYLVYRHFYPTGSKKGISRAVAAECVAEVADENIFWNFTNFLYANRPTADSVVEKSVELLGVDIKRYSECYLNGGKKRKKILKTTSKVKKLGARGTPFILVVVDHQVIGFLYALEENSFRQRLVKMVEDSGYSVVELENERN